MTVQSADNSIEGSGEPKQDSRAVIEGVDNPIEQRCSGYVQPLNQSNHITWKQRRGDALNGPRN